MSQTSRTLASRLLPWANALAGCFAAVYCVLTFLSPATLGLPVDPLDSRLLYVYLDSPSAWVVFLVALSLTLMNLLWLVRGNRSPAELPRHIVSEAPGGAVRVSCDALESGLRAAGEGLPEITRVRIQVVPTPSAKKARVNAWFQCPEGVSNLEASKLLRQALEERLASMVRLSEGGRAEMEIEFLGFSGRLRKVEDGKAAAVTEPPEEEEDPQPFRGPQYPIPEDEGSET